jgi:cold shock CspA family protein
MPDQTQEVAKEKGTVAKYISAKGYGFITPEGEQPNTGKDVCVHYTEAPEGIKEGVQVEYEIGTSENNEKDIVAINVTLLETTETE